MNAYVNHTFKSGFLLGEEDILKIHDIIRTRLKEATESTALKLKVYRSDNSVYLTENLADLRSEENAQRNQIHQVEFIVAEGDLKVTLSFERNESPELMIEGADRDIAFLLFSEIKEYLNTEVLVLRRPWSDRKDRFVMLGFLLVFQIGMIFFIVFKNLFPSDKRNLIQDAIKSSDSIAKLNALLQDKIRTDSEPPIMIGTLFGVSMALMLIGFIWNKAYPSSVFYLGKEIKAYDRLKSTRSKWVWGIGISFTVSFLASIAAWLLTKTS